MNQEWNLHLKKSPSCFKIKIMRTISFLILLLSSITIYAQTFLTLELCDTFPKNFYQKTNLEFLKVKNGYGYCHSPIKILDDQILNFKKLKELRYTVPTNQEFLSTQEFFPKAILKLPELTQLEINFIVPEIFELTNLERLSIRLFYGRSKGTEALREGNFGNFKKLKTLSINFHNSFRGKLKGLSELVNLENVILYYPSPEVLKDILELPNLKVLRVVANREILDQYEIKEVKASEVISLLSLIHI